MQHGRCPQKKGRLTQTLGEGTVMPVTMEVETAVTQPPGHAQGCCTSRSWESQGRTCPEVRQHGPADAWIPGCKRQTVRGDISVVQSCWLVVLRSGLWDNQPLCVGTHLQPPTSFSRRPRRGLCGKLEVGGIWAEGTECCTASCRATLASHLFSWGLSFLTHAVGVWTAPPHSGCRGSE